MSKPSGTAPFATYRHRLSPSKYHNTATTIDGIRFDSKREATRYLLLKSRRDITGEVRMFLRQVPFHFPGGGVYRCDFLVFWSDGRVTVEDSKGMKTQTYQFKKRLVEATYGVEITEV